VKKRPFRRTALVAGIVMVAESFHFIVGGLSSKHPTTGLSRFVTTASGRG
jgi:hypothetical protein